MPDLATKLAAQRDSEICVMCGFCCDGTLFDRASARRDSAESLVNIGLSITAMRAGKGAAFRLPCPHFEGKCSIYTSWRPHVCGAFRCRLLRDVDSGKHTTAEAAALVLRARTLREFVLADVGAISASVWGVDKSAGSLVNRLREILILLVRPEARQLRNKYGHQAANIFTLARILSQEFCLGEPTAGKTTMKAE